MIFSSSASPDFWNRYDALPDEIQRQADKQFRLFTREPRHPSLHLKPVGKLWSVRIGPSYRALAVRKKNHFFWFWIGGHDEYERLVR